MNLLLSAASLPTMNQSCDQCQVRRRKCSMCVKAELNCTYRTKLKKRGPKGTIVERLKKLQEDEAAVTTVPNSSQPPASLSDVGFHLSPTTDCPSSVALRLDVSPLALTPTAPPTHSLSTILTVAEIDSLVASYFHHIHPCYPFLDRAWFLDRLASIGPSDTVFGTMVLALCALTMAFKSDVIRSDDTDDLRMRRERVIAEVTLRHYTRALGANTTLEQVITTFHLGLYFSIVLGDEAGHFRIAESAHLARSMGLHHASTYAAMDPEERSRAIAVYCFVVVRNRACELRQGTSQVVCLGQSPLLPAFDDLGDPAHRLFSMDTRTVEICHLALLTNLFDVVTPEFTRCARDQCDLDSCHLGPSDVVKYTTKLQHAAPSICPKTFSAVQPALSLWDEVWWIEVLIGQQWIAAHIWHMAVRHGIDVGRLDGATPLHWPLDIADTVAQVLATANIRSVHILGTGLVCKLVLQSDAHPQAHRLSYINSCCSDYLRSTDVEGPAVEQALANLQSISEVVVGWDPRYWTRCVL
ncbi:hypothetical protein Q8F55_001637 [Vanrija albida]|uniref:Xylanolytic transcriptional activator regulatory domain-containing protein n=1 Tax=Vanrija albida TaxID=181172 RepID=A0ABR3Q7H1_9TREE